MTWDAIGLFTNIAHDEGLKSLRKTHQESHQEAQEVPTGYIIRILEIILENKIFKFHSEL